MPEVRGRPVAVKGFAKGMAQLGGPTVAAAAVAHLDAEMEREDTNAVYADGNLWHATGFTEIIRRLRLERAARRRETVVVVYALEERADFCRQRWQQVVGSDLVVHAVRAASRRDLGPIAMRDCGACAAVVVGGGDDVLADFDAAMADPRLCHVRFTLFPVQRVTRRCGYPPRVEPASLLARAPHPNLTVVAVESL